MPKMKTHSGTRKRVKVTGSGKLLREKAGKRHNLERKPSTMTRRMTGTVPVSPSDAKKVKRLLGKLAK
jgi:large subunit ribosomal protein L35